MKRILDAPDFQRMNLPEAYWRARVSGIPGAARAAVMRYLTRLSEMQNEGVGLLVVGPPGVGKTALAAVVMKECRSWGRTGFFTTIWELREGIKSRVTFDEHTGLLDRCREVDILVLDKFQAEDVNDLIFGVRAIEELITSRHARHKITILTTRLGLVEFRSNPKLASLFASSQGVLLPLLLEGENHRQNQHNRLVETILGRPSSKPSL